MPRVIERALVLGSFAIVSFWFMQAVRLSGDEISYTRGGRAIGLWVRELLGGPSPDIGLLDGVLQQGWFLPGMSVVLSPLYMILGTEVPVWLVRGYILTINVVLLWAISGQLQKRWGRTGERIFLVALALSPLYLAFLSTAWADVLSIHLGVLVLFWIYDRFLADEARPSPAIGVVAGVFVAGLTYIRPFYPIYLALIAGSSMIWLLRTRITRKRLIRAGVAVVSAIAVTVVLLLPWFVLVSEAFGPGLPTTAREISLIAWKGDPSVIDEAKEAAGSRGVFYSLNEYVWRRADSEGISYREAARKLEIEARVDRSWAETRALYRANVVRFYATNEMDASTFLRRFIALRCDGEIDCIRSDESGALRWWTTAGWRFLLVVGATLLLIPFEMRTSEDAFVSFLWKASVFSLAVWPLLRYTHSRYYLALVPLIALGAAVVVARRPRLIQPDGLKSVPQGWFVINAAGQSLAMLFVVAIVALMYWGV